MRNRRKQAVFLKKQGTPPRVNNSTIMDSNDSEEDEISKNSNK
jgi:hypothetical protein